MNITVPRPSVYDPVFLFFSVLILRNFTVVYSQGLTFTDKSSRSEKTLFILLVISLLTVLGLSIYIGVRKNQSSSSGTCTTQACLSVAGNVVGKMNTSADPCQNFYQYACGNWIANTVRPDYIGRLSSFTGLQNKNYERLRVELENTPTSKKTAVGKASAFFATCMNTSLDTHPHHGVLPTTDLLGSWFGPLADVDVTSAMIRSVNRLGAHPFFTTAVARDQRNTSRYLYHVSRHHFLLSGLFPFCPSYLKGTDCAPKPKLCCTRENDGQKISSFGHSHVQVHDFVYRWIIREL